MDRKGKPERLWHQYGISRHKFAFVAGLTGLPVYCHLHTVFQPGKRQSDPINQRDIADDGANRDDWLCLSVGNAPAAIINTEAEPTATIGSASVLIIAAGALPFLPSA